MRTGFFWNERCFWHSGGNYAFIAQVGGLVQPSMSGLPENPETKRRLRNLIEVTGLTRDLDMTGADPATWEQMARIHPEEYLTKFKRLSDDGGGELGLRVPFAKDGFEIAAQSAGLAVGALRSVLEGRHRNAYSLSRPPGHHCLPDFPNGFCLLSNIGIAIEDAFAEGLADRIAVVDWDVHHGNGTEAIFYDRADVLTISIHQERNYPTDTGDYTDRGSGLGTGANMNIPLPPGAGHDAYLAAWDQIVAPALNDFAPDVIVIACGFDAAMIDPLSRTMATAATFHELTERAMAAAEDLCDGRLVLVHEGGYSEFYVPFCGHAVLEVLSGSAVTAPDPMAENFAAKQPGGAFADFLDDQIEALARHFSSPPA